MDQMAINMGITLGPFNETLKSQLHLTFTNKKINKKKSNPNCCWSLVDVVNVKHVTLILLQHQNWTNDNLMRTFVRLFTVFQTFKKAENAF